MSTLLERARAREARRDRARVVAPQVVATMAPVVAAAAGMSNPLAVALVSAVPALVVVAATGYLGDAKAKLERWAQRLLGADGAQTPEEIRALYEVKIQASPSAREAVLLAVNRLLEADECTIDAIAALTHEYVSNDARPDDFYRGLLGLLATLSPGEYETLRALLGDVERTCSGRGSHAHLWAPLRFDERLHFAPGSIEHAAGDPHGQVDSHEFRGVSARRVVRLLRNALLLREHWWREVPQLPR